MDKTPNKNNKRYRFRKILMFIIALGLLTFNFIFKLLIILRILYLSPTFLINFISKSERGVFRMSNCRKTKCTIKKHIHTSLDIYVCMCHTYISFSLSC